MSSTRWRKNTTLTEQVLRAPADFDFLQIVKILERSGVYSGLSSTANIRKMNAHPCGHFSPPNQETLRYISSSSLTFPGAEIANIVQGTTTEKTRYWRVLVSFMGLTGSMGVLPFHYTEAVLQRLKNRDYAMERFLNLFNHRAVSLFYKASTRYRLPLQYESAKLARKSNIRIASGKQVDDSHTQALLSLVGLGTRKLTERQTISDETIIFYSGYFSQQIRTALGLKNIVSDYFGVPVEIKELVGQWQELINDVRTKLPSKENAKGQNACLGRTSMLGKRGWHAQNKVQVIIGPLNKQQYQQFAPGTSGLQALKELSRLYLGMDREFDIVVQIKRKDISTRVALKKTNAPIMGWGTWLAEKDQSRNRDDIMNIKMSSARLN